MAYLKSLIKSDTGYFGYKKNIVGELKQFCVKKWTKIPLHNEKD